MEVREKGENRDRLDSMVRQEVLELLDSLVSRGKRAMTDRPVKLAQRGLTDHREIAEGLVNRECREIKDIEALQEHRD